MREKITRTNVIVQVTEPLPMIITVKKRKFVRAQVVAIGSEVEIIKPGDEVMMYNEGHEIKPGTRILSDQGIIFKYV